MKTTASSKLYDFDLSVRVLNCCKACGIETIGQLLATPVKALMKVRNFGKKSAAELQAFVDSIELEEGVDDNALKAEDLQPNDLIYCLTPGLGSSEDAIQVSVIYIVNNHSDVGFVDQYGDLAYRRVESMRGIPLTGEILELNGFKKDGYTNLSFDYYYEDDKCSVYVNLKTGGGKQEVFSVYSKDLWKTGVTFTGRGVRGVYVHQLQHALRLCGLKELANNLKIKQL